VYSEYLLKDGHFSLRSPALGGELDTNKILGMQNAEEIKGLGETAVSTLINVLQDKNTLFWKWCLAAKTLGEMGPIALKAVPFLKDGLVDDRFEHAALGLSGIDPNDPELTTIIPKLIGHLGRGGERSLYQASASAEALRRINPPGEAFIELTQRIESAGVHVPLLGFEILPVKSVGFADKIYMRSLAFDLGHIGPQTLPALIALITAGHPHSVYSSEEDTQAVYYMLKKYPLEAVGLMVETYWALKAKGQSLQEARFAQALENIGRPEALPVLIDILKHSQEYHGEESAYWAIRGIKLVDEAVRILRNDLKNDDPTVRRDSAKALGYLGNEAVEATTDLITLLTDDWDVALKASSALDKMGAPKAEDIHTLINFLKHENEYIRVGAANALGKMGPLASQAIPALKHALKSVKYDEPEVKYAITEALERVEEKR